MSFESVGVGAPSVFWMISDACERCRPLNRLEEIFNVLDSLPIVKV